MRKLRPLLGAQYQQYPKLYVHVYSLSSDMGPQLLWPRIPPESFSHYPHAVPKVTFQMDLKYYIEISYIAVCLTILDRTGTNIKALFCLLLHYS